MLALLIAERQPVGPVLHQLDAVEVAGTPDVTDDGQVGQVIQGCTECRLVGPNVFEDVLVLEDLQVGQCHSAADRVAGEGDAVQERLAGTHERFGHLVAHEHRAEGRVAGGETLGAGDHVRLIAVALAPEHVPDPTEGADHLVGDEQHAVPVTDLAHPRPVAGRRGEAASSVLDRLQENSGDRLGSFPEDGLLDRVGGMQGAVGVVLTGRAPVVVGLGHLDGAGDQRFEHGLDGVQACDGQGPHGGAVVGEVAADDLDAVGLALQLEVLACQLPRRLDSLGTAGGEEHPVQVAGSQLCQLRRQLDGRRVAVGPDREVAERRRLIAGSPGQLGPAVAKLADEEARKAVEVTVALGIPDVTTLASFYDAGSVNVVLEDREVAPEMPLGQFRQPPVFAHRLLSTSCDRDRA